MENASKALIIAGAILLSISIIGIGMYVFNMASESMRGVGLDAEEIATYNGKFDKYVGTQRGTAVRTLCDTVRNHNLANVDDETKNVAITYNGTVSTTPPTAVVDAATVNTVKTSIKSGKTYDVEFGYDTNSGLIVSINIKDK